MDDDIRQQIESARSARDGRNAIEWLARACWPGGADDRSEPGALNWLRRWRPVVLGAAPSACSCATGRCTVCN
jgi:hypothetical protein